MSLRPQGDKALFLGLCNSGADGTGKIYGIASGNQWLLLEPQGMGHSDHQDDFWGLVRF